RVGRARVAAQSPLALGRHRVAREAAQEIDALLVGGAAVVHALDQVFEALRIARVAHAALDAPVLGGLAVGVEAFADLAQRAPQLELLRALHVELRERARGRRQDRHDCDRDQQLDQGEAARGFHRGCCTPPNGTIVLPCGCPPGAAAGFSGEGCGCGWDGTWAGGGTELPKAPAPPEASVPAENSTARTS